MNITHLDLFAGIGGFSRAVHWLGGTTVGFVEWDSWNRRVLAKHWPDAQFFGDIHDVSSSDLHRLGSVDLITGGYPCQPFSVAGQRRGTDDDRHLWPEMRRVIYTVRPAVVLAENVSGHVTMGLDTVLAEMESDGYTAGAAVSAIAGTHGWKLPGAVHDSLSDNPHRAWPTPQHHDAHQGQANRVGRYGTKHGGRNLNDDVAKAEGMEKAKLHGRWTLALMGFAPDWCDDLPPDPLGTTPT